MKVICLFDSVVSPLATGKDMVVCGKVYTVVGEESGGFERLLYYQQVKLEINKL